MSYISETTDFHYSILEDAGGKMVISGIYSLSDVRNRNKRVYPRTIWEKTLAEGSDFRRRLVERQVLGMLGHPADGKTKLREASHLITNMWIDDSFNQNCEVCKAGGNPHGHIMAEEEVLSTPDGKVLQELYRARVGLGISSRGSGSVRGGPDEQVVADDFKLETYDHVLDPSTPGAFPKVISESLVGAVEKLIDTQSSEDELRGYRKLLSEVVYSTQDDTSRGHAQQMIEAINTRLIFLTEDRGNSTPDNNTITSKVHEEDTEMSDELNRLTDERNQLISEREAMGAHISRIEADYAELQEAYTDVARELELAKALGEEAATQLKHTKLKLDGYQQYAENLSTQEMYDETHTVGEAFEKAKEIIESLLDQIEAAGELQTRLEAAEDMVARVRERERRRNVVSAVERILAQESDERARKLRPLLMENAETPEDVSRKYSQTIKLIGDWAQNEPLTDMEGLPNRNSITEEHGKVLGDPNRKIVENKESFNQDQTIARLVLQRIAR